MAATYCCKVLNALFLLFVNRLSFDYKRNDQNKRQDKISGQSGMRSRFAMYVVFNKASNEITSFQKNSCILPIKQHNGK